MSENNNKKSTIGQRVKIIREKHEPNQAGFAKKLGVSRATVSEIENDNTSPSGPLVLAIEYVYGVPREWILKGEGADVINDRGVYTIKEPSGSKKGGRPNIVECPPICIS